MPDPYHTTIDKLNLKTRILCESSQELTSWAMASCRTYHKQFEVSDTMKSARTYLVHGCVWFQSTMELDVVQDVQVPVKGQLHGSKDHLQAGGALG